MDWTVALGLYSIYLLELSLSTHVYVKVYYNVTVEFLFSLGDPPQLHSLLSCMA